MHPEDLYEAAKAAEVVINLVPRVGDHVVENMPIAWWWPDESAHAGAGVRVTERLGEHLIAAVLVGGERTLLQAAAFGMRQLVDIALKALSPQSTTFMGSTSCLSHQNCRIRSRSGSLSWESVKGVRLRTRGIDFAGSALVFPGRDGAPFSNKAFNARLKLACERARVPVISAHPLRHTAATLLLNEGGTNLRDVQALLGHRVSQPPRVTRTSIPSGCARSWETSGCIRSRFFFP